ncbi:DUF4168 domain-containing protein [Trichormus variabilis]|uniref:DUF4168 domain-containing protein n=1 Tax=Trichormus variabilis SAG 1403-4b TaxID=447716 RepID=A0A3S1BZ77_ANAVA|nr:DUF4168 domain-containing protein [Trichormus variabilis]MBD2628764.1 DUF4168 domain-containing protein [Trichormus variabilis FACHB-164]RUS94091.1 hypothetical protein DSM107003_39780 [Trichormus variabilis SAG 1403-4b]
MQENYFVFFPIPIQRILSHSLVFATLTSASVIFSTLGLSSKAAAQIPPVNNTEVTNYAQSVLKMEPDRQQAFDEIKKLIGEKEIPKIVCNDSSSMNSLPSKARDIAVNYCNRSQKIVENHGLSIERFNAITLELQNNSDLKRQVYNTLLRLQKASEKK